MADPTDSAQTANGERYGCSPPFLSEDVDLFIEPTNL
jgi:hypothetical protein